MVDYGTDLDDSFEIDPDTGDFKKVSGVDNAVQHIKNDLLTKHDELTCLGYVDYGNKSYLWLNTTNPSLSMAHCKIYVEEVLTKNPFVKDLIGQIRTEYKNHTITVSMDLLLVGGETVTVSEDIFTK